MRLASNIAPLTACAGAGATVAAENGATSRQLIAIFGWTTVKQAEQYTKKASRKRLAGDAMHLLKPARTGEA
jgi:hypothetical protein